MQCLTNAAAGPHPVPLPRGEGTKATRQPGFEESSTKPLLSPLSTGERDRVRAGSGRKLTFEPESRPGPASRMGSRATKRDVIILRHLNVPETEDESRTGSIDS